MLSKLHLIFTIVGVTISASIFSQTPSFYHYSSSDGLASSTAFEIIQDHNGFIWVATLNGVSRFDGKNFLNYRSVDGLHSNSTISIVEGNNGEIYAGSYEKGVSVFKNGMFENYCNKINGNAFYTSYLLFDSIGADEQKIYTLGWNSINIIHEKNSFQSTYLLIGSPDNLINLKKLPNNKTIVLTTGGLYHLIDDQLSKFHVTGLPDITFNCIVAGEANSFYLGSKGLIWQIKNNKVIKQYPINLYDDNEVSHIFSDRHNNIWFSIMNRGFFLIPNGSDQIMNIGAKMDLQNTLVNNYFEDKEGNLWICTFGKGIYCLNNLYIKNYTETDGLSSNNIYSITKEKSGKLIIGTFNGLNILENGVFHRINNYAGVKLTEYIYSAKIFNDELYICEAFRGNELVNVQYKEMKLHFFNQFSFCKTTNGLYLSGSGQNCIIVRQNLPGKPGNYSIFYLFGDTLNSNRVNEIFEDSQKNIWVGTSSGLCKLSAIPNEKDVDLIGNLNRKKTFFPDNPVLNSRIKTIFQDQQNHIWVSGEKGVASYNLTNDSIKTYTTINGYDLSSSTSIAADNKNRIWIGNMKGLFLLDGDSIICLNRQTGLPTNEILSLCFDHEKNMLYVGTSNGLSFLDIDLFDNNVHPPLEVKIVSIKAGDSIHTNYNNLVFKPNQNHVYLNFKALCYASPSSVMYKYKLNDEWVETDHDFLDLVSLKYGTYHLQIMAKSQNTNWSNPLLLTFQVLPKFIETTWFYLLIMLVLGLISISTMAWWLNRNKIKAQNELELTERINELKHLALSAMMNPHFIFNSLNSVQYLINCQKSEEANHYISTMAKLIRKNLDTAGNGFILLSEEIYRLKLYLELEKLRFREGFSYEINIGQDIYPQTFMIPNMIIQPFVENTLWHGIINSGSKGMITILFSFEAVEVDATISKSLIIKVTDNGIGINAAHKNKKEDHISKGIQIIEERLQLLSAKMHLPQPIMLEDLSSRNKHSHGTEVIISLPPSLYKIIPPKSQLASITV